MSAVSSMFLALSLLSAPATVPVTPAATGEPTLRFEPYLFQTARHGHFQAQVAYFDVPQHHTDPGGPTMRLRVVRLPARSGTPRETPIVYLAGGPGGSGVDTARGARWPVFDTVRANADVLLLDQRGTGLSGRHPACPHRHAFDDQRAIDAPGQLAALRSTAARCVAHWRAEGIALDAYNTQESAHDIEALRRALGAERISLWGMSYGTHLAMATLRLYDDRIESAVLMGTEGPDDTIKLPLSADALLAKLEEVMRDDPRAARFAPDLRGTIRRVLETLEHAPAQGRIRRPTGSATLTIGRFDAQLGIAAALGRTRTARLLPIALAEAEQGNYDVLAEFVHAAREHIGSFEVMPLAMDLASGLSPARRALVEAGERASLLGPALNFPFPGIGEDLGIPDLGDDFRAPLRSATPTLFISGTLDGRTPPANAATAAAGFDHASHLTLEGAGHDDDLWLGQPEIPTRIADFFAGLPAPDARLSTPPITFATSLWRELLQGIVPRLLTGTGAALLLGVLTPPILAGWGWRRRRAIRRKSAAETGSPPLL